ncbi:MAG: helix-turn-helix transcriptional regulator [Oscillospiraceae bacterium]|nr:helix-turn-helix transcriptional regulator [Oscillospiraceae bacterium]
MNINQKEIGQRIAKIRTDYSLTQEQFANILNTSCSHISKIEIGAHGMSLDLIADISVQFNVSTDYILLGKDTHSYDTKIKLKSAIDQLNALMKAL